MSADENNLIWIDLEMTGLDPERDRIIEIATLVTDANLNILAEDARRRKRTGTAVISFSVNEQGDILSSQLGRHYRAGSGLRPAQVYD
jgi:oligoribonuclease (3'-5' exoribonuclease)